MFIVVMEALGRQAYSWARRIHEEGGVSFV
jgi:hypothetical protein